MGDGIMVKQHAHKEALAENVPGEPFVLRRSQIIIGAALLFLIMLTSLACTLRGSCCCCWSRTHVIRGAQSREVTPWNTPRISPCFDDSPPVRISPCFDESPPAASTARLQSQSPQTERESDGGLGLNMENRNIPAAEPRRE